MADKPLAMALTLALDYLDERGAYVPLGIVRGVYNVTKTYGHYLRVLEQAAHDFYRESITDSEFIDVMIATIEEQLTKAWHEGMRANGLEPEDMEPEWEEELADIIASEYDHVLDFAQAIQDATEADKEADKPEASWPGLKSRAGTWADRYNDVVNRAKLATANAKDRYKWEYGDTDHCSTCFSLDGVVASAEEWEEAGLQPQNPPNDALECGGWKCQCRLTPTTERRTQGRKELFASLAR